MPPSELFKRRILNQTRPHLSAFSFAVICAMMNIFAGIWKTSFLLLELDKLTLSWESWPVQVHGLSWLGVNVASFLHFLVHHSLHRPPVQHYLVQRCVPPHCHHLQLCRGCLLLAVSPAPALALISYFLEEFFLWLVYCDYSSRVDGDGRTSIWNERMLSPDVRKHVPAVLPGGVAGKVEELQWVSAFTSLLLFVLLLG